MMLLANPGGFVVVFILACFACLCSCGKDSACDYWTQMAKTMTGSGRHQKCVSDKTDVCSRIDCEGSRTETVMFVDVPVDYCFGYQLNSCLEPLSMDFYLKVPSFNYSHEFRVSHDQPATLKGLNIPHLASLRPVLDFEFERVEKGSVLVSVTLKMETSTPFPIDLDQLQIQILDEEEIPIQHCSTAPKAASSDKPDKNFMAVQCHPLKYPSQQPTYNVDPSETFNQTCGISKNTCSVGETCELTSDDSGICHCEPDYTYIEEKKVCVSQGRVGMECSNIDCGVYEECEKDAVSGLYVCQCEDSFHWDKGRKLCIIDTHGSSSSHKGHGHDKTTTTTTTTLAPSPQPGKMHSASTHTNKYFIIGGAIAGFVVILTLLVGGFIFCRRRGRQSRFSSGSGLHDSDNPLLADTDDDVDLVM